jgi:hypothetical protein
MVLQSSGAISLANIQTEFGGANPIGLNEYYLNGAYTTGSGATGIPTSGAISLGSFYGKSKIVSSAWLPTAAQTTYSNFPIPWGVGNTYYMWQNGASGTNSTRTGGSTFNNLGSDGQNRANFINYQNLILQCMPGDNLSFQMRNGANANYFTMACILLNLGAGWFIVAPPYGNGSFTVSATYTLPATTAPGNYGIAVYCDYDHAASVTYSSANFYSLHVVSSYAPTAVQSTYGNFGLPWGLGSTYYNWIAGASGTNLTRTTGTTFNNLGADNYQNSPNFRNYQSLILQAKPGDTLRFVIQSSAIDSDLYYNSLLLNLGGGWFTVSSPGASGGHTNTTDYTISASQTPGSYGIAIYNDWNNVANGAYSSASFYSLQIAN